MHSTVKMSTERSIFPQCGQSRSVILKKAAKIEAKKFFFSLIRPIFYAVFKKVILPQLKYTLALKFPRYNIHQHHQLHSLQGKHQNKNYKARKALRPEKHQKQYCKFTIWEKKYQTDRSIYQFAIAIEIKEYIIHEI